MNTQQNNQQIRNGISGVLLSKVNREHLLSVMKAEKIDYDKENDEDVSALTVAAYAHFDRHTAESDLAQCDSCGGVSPDRLDVCPYCGEGGNDGEANETKPAEPEAPKEEAPKTEVVAAPKKKKGKEADMATSTALATTKKKNGTNGASTHAIEKVDTKALDSIVVEIKRLRVEGAALAWQLGRKVLDVYKGNLWKNRTEGDGEKQSYKTFDQFCHKELDMTPAHAYSLMDVAEHFDEAKVREFGSTKLSLVLQAPPQAQPKLLKQVEQGAAVRDLKKEVTSLKKKTGHRRETRAGAKPNRNTAAASKARSEKATAAKAKKEITVAKIIGRETVKMYCKPTTKTFEEKDLKPAKKLADVPYGRLELANGVVQEFFIQGGGDGAIKLVVHTHRAED